jgi:drug/metabolite transporter (DMT)-like permease
LVASDPRTRSRADMALLIITAGWGSTFVVVHGALADISPQAFLALRFGLASLVLAVAAAATATLRDRASLLRGALLGLPLYAGFALQTHGLLFTTPSRSAFLTGLTVLIVPVLGMAFRRPAPALPTRVGIALALVGLTLLTRPWTDAGRATLLGDVLTLFAAGSFALHILGTEVFAAGRQVVPLVLAQVTVTAALSCGGAWIEGGAVAWTPALLAAVAGTGVLATAAAFLVQAWAQQRTTAARTVLIFSVEPVVAAAFSAALTGERFGPHEIAGGALILSGVLTAELVPLLGRARAGARSTGA